MALRGGNALNSGSARKSAKFVKPKLKTGGRTLRMKKMPMEATPVKRKTKTTVAKTSSPSTAMSRGAAKAKRKMVGGKGRRKK